MLRIKAHYGKKVAQPGTFGSTCFGADVEIELADSEATNVEGHLAGLWKRLEVTVEKQIATEAIASPHSPALSPSNGASKPSPKAPSALAPVPARAGLERDKARENDAELLSAKQRGFILGLGAKSGLKLPALHERARRDFGKTVFELSRSEASSFIDLLRESLGDERKVAS